MKLTTAMINALAEALNDARIARNAGDFEGAWDTLIHAHIISQPALLPHLAVHTRMLGLAFAQSDMREIVGQMLRLALAPLGHFLGRTPWGNPGRANVSKFARVPLPKDVAVLYAEAGVEVK